MHWTVANWLFDTVMPDKDANGSAFKVVSAVARMTAGWSRQWSENPLSFSDFENLTGMARDSVANGLSVALEKGYIKRQKSGRSFIYSLAVNVPKRSDNPTGDSPKTQLQTPEQSENPTDSDNEQLDYPTDNSPEIQPITGDTLYKDNKDNLDTPQPPPEPKVELPEPFKPKHWGLIPTVLQDNELKDAWAEWEYYHEVEKHNPLARTTARLQLKDMAEWGVKESILAIEYTMKKGWTGLKRPPDNGYQNGSGPTFDEMIDNAVQSIKQGGGIWQT